jgi:hypothetical protein
MKHIINLLAWVIIVLPCIVLIVSIGIIVFLWTFSWKRTVKIMDKLDNKFYHPVFTELINRTYELRLIPILILGLFFTSCGNSTYNVQLKDGSIVEVHNEINSYDYQKGDTVGIYYSNVWEKWYITDRMRDTTTYYGGYKVQKRGTDSVYIPISYHKERIGIIK